MSVQKNAMLKGVYNSVRAIGDKVISAEFSLEIEGFENMWLLVKQFPMPAVKTGEPIDTPLPMGFQMRQSSQISPDHTGAVTFFETEAGQYASAMAKIIEGGNKVNAKFYEGTPDSFLRYHQLYNVHFTMEAPDRDIENRTQLLMYTGNVSYEYFGEIIVGNRKPI